MPGKNRVYDRQFLNTSKSLGAYVKWTVEHHSYGGNGRWGSFEIADCSDHVSLDCGFDSAKQRRAVRTKLARLRKALDAFEAELFRDENTS